MSKIDPTYYDGLSAEFYVKLNRINYFTNHGPSIGRYREELLKSTIRNFLPQRFSVRTGFVFAETGIVSNQIDILVVDESEATSYFYQDGEFVIVHPDAVVCGIEVKSTLNKTEFQKAVRNCYSLKKLIPYGTYKKNFGTLIFSYDGTTLGPQTTDSWWKSIDFVPEDLVLYPELILNLKKGFINLRTGKNGEPWGHYFVMGEDKSDYQGSCLSLFLYTIRKYTELKAGKVTNPFSYAHIPPGQTWSQQYLRFGKGLKT